MLAQNKTNLSGQQIGNYELKELLVSRDATDFYLGRDTKLDQPVFIEILQSTNEQDPDMAGSFQRRMEAVSQIKHPNIAPVIDIDVTRDNYTYAVIEHTPGVWLEDQLSEWSAEEYILPVQDSLLLVRQIADALSVAHPAGLVDPDLRPSNIILREDDNSPILVDLGVPVIIKPRDAVLTNRQSNRLDYSSPEEIEGKAIGRRSNIYSLGILLYELLTGHRPKLPTSSWDIFEHSTMPKEVPLEEERQGLSGETYRLVRNCLWRQEWSRFESADELISAIDTAILAEQSLPKTTIWSGRRRRWLYVAVPLLALLVLIFGLILVWSQFARAQQGTAEDSDENGSAITTEDEVSTPTVSAVGGLLGVDNTPEPTETITREAPPTSAADNTVSVFNPSADQTFARNDSIGFAWVWLTVLNNNEEFAVYVVSEDNGGDPILVGITAEPDDASLYVVESSARELDLTAGSYLWQVHLVNRQTGEMILESDPRRILIAADPTPTPTEIPPTNTPTASPTATEIPPTPTATEVACVPSAPFGWLTHQVERGETPSFYAERANVRVQDIFAANCLRQGAILSIGQQLFIPPPLATNTPIPLPTDTPSPDIGGGGGSGGGGDDDDNGGGGSRSTSTPRPPPPRPADESN
jgi:serine/threonine protein kinase